MNRRTFIKSAGITILTVPTFGVLSYLFKQSTPEKLILSSLRQQLPYLNVTNEEYLRFIDDIKLELLKRKTLDNNQRTIGNMVASYDNWLEAYQPYSELRDIVIERLSRHFLLSSDFFLNGANLNNQVTYIAWYNPLVRPCQNPFSNLEL